MSKRESTPDLRGKHEVGKTTDDDEQRIHYNVEKVGAVPFIKELDERETLTAISKRQPSTMG